MTCFDYITVVCQTCIDPLVVVDYLHPIANPPLKQGGALALYTALHTEHKLGEPNIYNLRGRACTQRNGDPIY